MKKIDQLVLKTFLGPFLITFVVAFFMLLMQSLWKYIDDLVGKGIDFKTILLFIWYAGASLSVLAFPIAIIISSLMAFGNLAEQYELVAIKSAGISFNRLLRSVVIFSIVLCGITFLFANYVIPYSTLKFYTLYQDIRLKKPAFDLQEGIFYGQIPGYSIRVDKKDADNKTIRGVLIYDQSNYLQDNTLVAELGIMDIINNSNNLNFVLKNGYRYQEKPAATDTASEYIRLKFKQYNKLFDLSSFQQQKTPDSFFKSNYRMLNAKQLKENIDSFNIIQKNMLNQASKNMDAYIPPVKPYKQKKQVLEDAALKNQPITKLAVPDSILNIAEANTRTQLAMTRDVITQNANAEIANNTAIRQNKIEYYRKYAFALACLVLLFIGAPLGSIVRKGGLGVPLLIAIIFFLIYHLLNMFGEKLAKTGTLTPFLGMYLAVIVLAPIGAYLMYVAAHDGNVSTILSPFKKLRSKFVRS